MSDRPCVLLKIDSHFDIRCFCEDCKINVAENILNLNWKFIQEGLYEDMNNQKIILNKLYNTDFWSNYQKVCELGLYGKK